MFDDCKRHPARLSVGVPVEMPEALRTVAAGAGASAAEVARASIRRGLDPMREALRSRKRCMAAPELSERLYQRYKSARVATWRGEVWAVDPEGIRAWLAETEAAE